MPPTTPPAGPTVVPESSPPTASFTGEQAGLPALVEALLALVRPQLAGRTRTIVGITGPPGAGKSTLAEAFADAIAGALAENVAEALTEALAESTTEAHVESTTESTTEDGARRRPESRARAVVVPMDGFHLSNVELERLGLADRKGALATFDGAGFVHLLARIRAGGELVYAPAYSRVLHESIGGVVPVFPDTGLVVVEGNYLLVPEAPWSRIRALCDLVVYLDVAAARRREGLVRRQRERGLAEAAALDWVRRSDEENARVVEATRGLADAILTRGGPVHKLDKTAG